MSKNLNIRLKEVKKNMMKVFHQIENINMEIKRNQMEILELKIIVT